MHAVTIHEYGGPEVLTYEEIADPEIGPGEVLVKVHAAGVNPIDCMTRAGTGVNRAWAEHRFPLIVGWDISGAVVESNAADIAPGDEVYGMPRFPAIANCYAELVAAPANELAAKPSTVSHADAAAMPLAALTAWQGLFEHGGLTAGERILVHAGAGGVGHLAVQFAKWKGAHVVATASAANEAFVRRLGADEFIDYNAGPYADRIEPVDIVFHTIPRPFMAESFKALKYGGRMITITAGPIPEDDLKTNGATGGFISVRPHAGDLATIATLVEEGSVAPEVGHLFPLKDAADAHRQSEGRHTRGKIVLEVAD
jgi:NADPH:quinone reductase-like Zn-dependent oxidoreductase